MIDSCTVHPLYFPEEGPPKGHRMRCLRCLRLYLTEQRKKYDQIVMDTEEFRDAIAATRDGELIERYNQVLKVMKGDT
jgi:hypothetical protein